MYRILSFVLTSVFAGVSFAAPPKVSVSVAPLHSVVSYIQHDVAEPKLILNKTSPHSARLAPSAIKAVAQADWVIWTGADLEQGLAKVIAKVKPARSIEVLKLNLPHKMEMAHHDHDHEEHNNHDDKHHAHDKNKQGLDPHVWLSPDNMATFAQWLSKELSAADPENAEIYQRNFRHFMTDLQYISGEILRRLQPIRGKAYAVYHPAYGYYESFFKLPPSAALAVNPELGSTAKQLAELQKQHRNDPLVCIFTEPQFNQEKAKAFAEANQLKLGQLDPLGNDLASDRTLYFKLLENLTANLVNCLKD